MQTQLAAFFEYLQVERQVSVHTLTAYRTDLAKVVDFTSAQR